MHPPTRSSSRPLLTLVSLAVCAITACTTPGSTDGDAGVTSSGGQTAATGGTGTPSNGSGGIVGSSSGGVVGSSSGGVSGAAGHPVTGSGGGTGTGAQGGKQGSGGTAGAHASGGSGPSTGGVVGGGSGGAGGRTPTGSGGVTPTGSGGAPSSNGGASAMTTPGMGCTPPSNYANLFVTVSGHTQADSDAKVAAAWTSLFTAGGSGSIYFNGPGSDESYVKDTYNNDVRTEGMSYGMIIAVELDHQTEFDRMWAFTKAHMAQGTGQIAWHVSTSGSKLATGGAPDGDEYFATALIFAHNRWGDTSGKYDYGKEAQWVLDMIRTMDFNAKASMVQFYAGSGNTDGSYVLPAFYQVWACFDTANADFWNAAVTAGRMFFHNAVDSNGVIGDQSSFTGQTTKGAGADTIRCVANIMMDHNFFNADPWQTDTYATKYGAYEMSHSSGVAQQSCNALLGFGLPASMGKSFVDKIWSTNPPKADYWNGVLYMLGMLHVSGNFKLYY